MWIKIKVCLFDDSVGLTGSGVYLYFIAKKLLEKKCEVFYIHQADTKHIKNLYTHSNFTPIKINGKINSKFLMLNKLSLLKIFKTVIKDLIKKEDIDLIHLNESFNPYFNSINKILRENNIKSVTTAHGCCNYEAKTIIWHPLVNFKEKVFHSIYYPPLLTWEIYNLSKIPNYITVTSGIKEKLTQIGLKYWHHNFKSKMTYIQNGVNLKRFNTRKPDNNYLQKIKSNDDEIIILFSGGLVIRKLPLLLINSFYLLNKKIPNIRLVLVGGGRLFEYCKNMVYRLGIKNIVNFMGYVDYEQMPKILSIADIFVLPSIYETPGISILEAMAMKVPIIASNLPDMDEIIKDNVNGILFNNDENAIRNLFIKMKYLVENEEFRANISSNAYKFLTKNHNIDKITEKIYSYYKILI
ncbi:MAG: glycosyltransferase family 4 protein [Candidatus Helarchaeota archaeon]